MFGLGPLGLGLGPGLPLGGWRGRRLGRGEAAVVAVVVVVDCCCRAIDLTDVVAGVEGARNAAVSIGKEFCQPGSVSLPHNLAGL